MTDRQGALMVLASLDGAEREAAFADFYERYRDDSLVLDKWFALQAAAQRPDTVRRGRRRWPGIPISASRNPNRWRALVGNFAANQWAFHDASGRGYRFVADMILEVDRINPQVAARQVPSLGRWRRFEPKRAELMRAELERIVATPGLQQGRVRAGVEEPGLNGSAADPLRDFGRDLVGGGVERRADRRCGAVGRTRALRSGGFRRAFHRRVDSARVVADEHRALPARHSRSRLSVPVSVQPGIERRLARVEHHAGGGPDDGFLRAGPGTAGRAYRPTAGP